METPQIDETDKEFFNNMQFIFVSMLGKGSFGLIFLVKSLKYKQNFAVKRISQENFDMKELSVMTTVDSPFITRLYQYLPFKNYCYFVMEYCEKSLGAVTWENQLSAIQMQHYSSGILRSIKALHDQNICHGDIKPSNFLIDKYNRVKVCDFGMSQMCSRDNLSQFYRGTMMYLAPEIIAKQPYDPLKADIWSIGITLYCIATGTYPFPVRSPEETMNFIKNCLINYTPLKRSPLRDVIRACLQKNPKSRPTVDQLLRMEYFSPPRSSQHGKPLARVPNVTTFLVTCKNPKILMPKITSVKSFTK